MILFSTFYNVQKSRFVYLSLFTDLCHQREYFHGFKQATRREDDISLVNAGLRVELDEDHVVQVMTLTFGGMGVTTLMAHKTVEGLIGRYVLVYCLCGNEGN